MTTSRTLSRQFAAPTLALSVSLHSIPTYSEVLVSAPLRSTMYACHLVNVSSEPVPLGGVEIFDSDGLAAYVHGDACDKSLEPARSCYVWSVPGYDDGPHYCRLHHDSADGAILASFPVRDVHELRGATAMDLKPVWPLVVDGTDSFSVGGRCVRTGGPQLSAAKAGVEYSQ